MQGRKKSLALLLAAAMVIGSPSPAVYAKTSEELAINVQAQESSNEDTTKCFNENWTEVTGDGWRDGMISGNGENGVVTTGSPYGDRLIYQYMYFSFPSGASRFTPDETGYLDEARQAVFNLDDSWNVHGRSPEYSYAFHPGHQLALNMAEKNNYSNYKRWTDYETAEVGVRYSDRNGDWQRKTFVSREDNVVITRIDKSSTGAKVNMTVSIDDIQAMSKSWDGLSTVSKMQYKKLVDENADYIAEVGHYPAYDNSELKEGGFVGLTRVVTVGGQKERVLLKDTNEAINVGKDQNPAIKITDADAVYLVTKSKRTHTMGTFEEFRNQTQYDLLDELLNHVNSVIDKEEYQTDGFFDYDKALAPHAKLHGDQFNAVKFKLDGDEADKLLDNETLINKQKGERDRLNHAFIERAYNAGRYAQLCCAGISAPRLYGMWTGEWQPGWRGIYTLDANVNIQVSPMNTGNMEDSALGYITFFLRNAPDFEVNAEKIYGMHDAIQVPVNSDGERGILVEYYRDYPFQYWNSGASWTLLPIFEYWQCYGNQQIPLTELVDYQSLKSVLCVEDGGYTEKEMEAVIAKGYLDLEQDILLPLLTKQANFWEQFLTPEYYIDVDGKACYQKGKTKLEPGETYMLIPTYSPENHPRGYNSTITANATMDIAAARDGLSMVIEMEKAVGRPGSKAAIEKWENLKSLLPKYKFDNTDSGKGALREWAMEEYIENNDHRHLSHLYLAWPGYETQNDEQLFKAAKQAVANRNNYNYGDTTASHGWMHKALVNARLKDGEGIITALKPLMTDNLYYTSMMGDHDTNRRNGTYCTDTIIGTVGVIQEAMVFSNTGEIEIIPALPDDWKSGSMDGILARTRAEVEKMSWNTKKGTANVQIRSDIDQTIRLKCGMEWSDAVVSEPEKAEIEYSDYITLNLKQGDVVTVDFYNGDVTNGSLAEAIDAATSLLQQNSPDSQLYNKGANEELQAVISAAKDVYFGDDTDSKAIREAIWKLQEAMQKYEDSYRYQLVGSLQPGIYQKRQKLGIEHTQNDRMELRYTLDGSEVTKDSCLYSGVVTLPTGKVSVRAAQFIKDTDVQVGDTFEADYLIYASENKAKNKAASINRNIYNGQGADKAVDGNAGTRLSVSGNYSDYILSVDLGEPTEINQAYLDEYVETIDRETNRIQTFELQYQDLESGEWQTAYKFDENNVGADMYLSRPNPGGSSAHAYYGIEFNEITARQVRLVMTATKEISIWEFQLFNQREELELVNAIAKAESLLADEQEYETQSWADMVAAYQKAKELFERMDVSQAELDTVVKELNGKIAALKPKEPETKKDFTVSTPSSSVYTGKAITPAVTVKDQDKVLKAGSDYSLTYQNNVNVGSATIQVNGLNSYKDVKKSVSFTITAYPAANLKIKADSKKVYTGKMIKPVPVVTHDNTKLLAGRDYTVSYSGNKMIGTAKITIRGIGNYAGSKTVTFTIIPKAPQKLTLKKSGASGITLKWKTVKGVSGYHVYRSTAKNGKYRKVKTLNRAGKVSYRATNLKKNKKYYYYVKAFKKVKGKKIESNPSKVVIRKK